MKFDFRDYTEDNVAMYCETDEEVLEFSKILDEDGRRWADGSRYTDLLYDAPLYFTFNNDTLFFTKKDDVLNEQFRVLYFSDFAYDDDDNQYPEDSRDINDCINFLLG